MVQEIITQTSMLKERAVIEKLDGCEWEVGGGDALAVYSHCESSGTVKAMHMAPILPCCDLV